MGNRVHVRVTGPLAPYAAGFEEDLARQGYRSASDHLYVMAQLSRWLCSEKLDLGDVSGLAVEEFRRWRTASGYVSALSLTRLTCLIDHLVFIGVVATFEAPLLRRRSTR